MRELTGIVNQLKTDENHKLLSTFKPSEKELRLIFEDGESVDKAIAYSQRRWSDMSKVSKNSMKPLTEDAELTILSVSKTELLLGKTNGLPEAYLNIPDHLIDGTTLYAMQYLNEDGSEQKMRSAFFKAADRWVIVPLAYEAFE